MGSDQLYFGGSFQKVDGQTRNFLASVMFDGTLTSWAPNANDNVRSLAFAPDGNTIFVGGHFTTMNSPLPAECGPGERRDRSDRRMGNPGGCDQHPADRLGADRARQPALRWLREGAELPGRLPLDNGNSGTQVWRFNTVGNVESLALSADGTKLYAGGHFGTGPLNQTVCGNLRASWPSNT